MSEERPENGSDSRRELITKAPETPAEEIEEERAKKEKQTLSRE
ncbi:hypothetical protein NTE_01599 [Candidatus Nitrososphaera evergladensis SR1]|jgi:hypothetical protein|uniref:Uncharacterized protein n=1 Tax=Candidatus Nitrososphaera evergladensis SR1 TaxID=1459636 RepID=A0A075MS80_9ARCH|nr:hypothetical protein [Candidatus Nitrososphaera evergladensis]AIF83662.1 hypothetical protein NTE_01599 [Candidatus Nitrososphaera evergladensis SR1]